MSIAASVSEIAKLAHQLNVDPDRLKGLSDVPPEELRTLREQISDALFRADQASFVKVASAAKAVPTPLAAKVAEKALPPLLAARTAEVLDHTKGVELVKRLSDDYLADVAVRLDARRAAKLIADLPADRVAMVSRELSRRGEWIVMGAFVVALAPAALAATVADLTGEMVLRIAFVLDDKDRMGDFVGLITDQQINQMRAARVAKDLQDEWADLVTYLTDDQRARLEG